MRILLLSKSNMPASKSLLDPPKESIQIRPECITTAPATLLIKQDITWSRGGFTIKIPDATTILTSTDKVGSNSARKESKDASGLPVFTLRRSWFSFSPACCSSSPHPVGAVPLGAGAGEARCPAEERGVGGPGGGNAQDARSGRQ